MKPFYAAETLYDVEELKSLRESVIVMRDEALSHGAMTWALCLSHVIAIFAHIIAEMGGVI